MSGPMPLDRSTTDLQLSHTTDCVVASVIFSGAPQLGQGGDCALIVFSPAPPMPVSRSPAIFRSASRTERPIDQASVALSLASSVPTSSAVLRRSAMTMARSAGGGCTSSPWAASSLACTTDPTLQGRPSMVTRAPACRRSGRGASAGAGASNANT